MNQIIKEILYLSFALLIAALISLGAKAELPKDTDYHNTQASQQISQQIHCEDKGGVWHNALRQCLPPDLTAEQESYLKGYVAGLQQKQESAKWQQ